jgi:hypothetical protein
MEFLRFGSKIPGSYWGCCALDIIQNFCLKPDAPASIQLVHGDTGVAIQNVGGENLFAGPTYEGIFNTRLRIGTFGRGDLPNHAFFASLTGEQLRSETGKQWLAILKANGFEFIRAVDNSVYSGPTLEGTRYRDPVYVFALFRNIGNARLNDPFKPPKEWMDISSASPEVWDYTQPKDMQELAKRQTKAQTKLWEAGKTSFMTEKELRAVGAPVTLAGKAGDIPKTVPEEPVLELTAETISVKSIR